MGLAHEVTRAWPNALPVGSESTGQPAAELCGGATRPVDFATAPRAFLPEPVEPELDVAAALELLRDLDADACRESLAEFVKLAFAVVQPGVELEWGPHLQAICDHVQWQLEDRDRVVRDKTKTLKLKCRNLLINVPPRSLKSIILTCATVWAWLRWPSLAIMYLSANPRVASVSARMARDLIRSQWFVTTFTPSWQQEYIDDREGREGDPLTEAEWEAANPTTAEAWELRSDQDALSSLGNTAGGKRIARGMGSVITGEGCEWCLIDDPSDARDGSDRVEKAVEEYFSAIHDRLNSPRTSIRTCIMQRLRVNDLSAKWIEQLTSLVHLRLPTEYETDDKTRAIGCQCGTCVGTNIFGFRDWRTEDGDLLHPRFDTEFIAAAKKTLQSRYVGQHLQRPLESGGQIFKTAWWSWWSLSSTTPATRPIGARTDAAHVLGRRRDGSLDLDFVDVSVDCTGGSLEKTASNLGIGIVSGKGERRFLMRDCTEGPATWMQTKDRIKDALVTAVRLCGKQPMFGCVVEKKALGQAAIEEIQKFVNDGNLRYPDGSPVRVRVEGYEPSGKGSKEERIDHMEPDIASGLVHLEDGNDSNTGPFRAEVEGYPKMPKNDRPDYLAQALDHRRVTEAPWVTHFRRQREEKDARIAAIAAGQRAAAV